jgi:hypothetical protein
MTTEDLVRPDAEMGHATTGTTVLLVGAPLLMAIGRVLLVPLDDQDWDGVMTSMAAHQGRSDAGWVIALAATGLLTVTAVYLANLLRATGRARMAMFATVTTALGWTASAALCAGGLYLSIAAGAPDRAAQVQLQEDFQAAAASGVGFLMVVVGAVGYIVLAFGLARSNLMSKGAAVLIAIGGTATLITTPGPMTPLLVLAALLLTAGHGLAVRTES